MRDKDAIVEALTEEWAAIGELMAGLDPALWTAATPLPGWTVRDTLAHVVGTEQTLLGGQPPVSESDPSAPAHVKNDIGAINEAWVVAYRQWEPAALLEHFSTVTARRAEALSAMTQADFDEPSWTPAGTANYGRFMQIRVFDCWMHEQDMRDGVGIAGHESGPAAELSLDEISLALGYVVGKKAAAPEGALVVFELTGSVERVIAVEVQGRARVIDPTELAALDREPTAVLGLRAGLFTRLAGGRTSYGDHEDEVSLSGDIELGTAVAGALAFTI
jgi:uncharacterized protein (TIGR03083 family)